MVKTGHRHQAREAALQILYQWEVGKVSPDEAVARHWEIEQEADALPDPARRFAEDLVRGTVDHVAALDALIEQHAQHWRLERMAVVDRLILRMAAFELVHVRETPHSVVIDEAIELARTFSEQDAVRFVNGVLDAVHHALAPGPAEPGPARES
ncbi:MAG: transcription antitermination factor NusB [Acidobacteria bacterium]|nr:transcription antitermination factor NusB [Acidobacteriota bacterium]